MKILEKVAAFCQREALFADGDKLLVACSGGPDSLALLDMLAKLAPAQHLQLLVCYIHHGIRKAADAEVGRVWQEASRRHCTFVCCCSDVPAIAAREHRSLEAVGREERYRLLRQEAKKWQARAIAVAHHRNDQAETVLLHVLRGSGLSGLKGMRPKSGDIIRPLLDLTRQEIDEYIEKQQLQPCHDETNDSDVFARNRIRLRLLPYLKQYNPAIIADLNRLALLAQADDDFLQQETARVYAALVVRQQKTVCIDKKKFLAQPLAIQRRIIRLLCHDVTGSMQNISFHYVETVRNLAFKGAGKQFQTGTWLAYTTRTALCMKPCLYRR